MKTIVLSLLLLPAFVFAQNTPGQTPVSDSLYVLRINNMLASSRPDTAASYIDILCKSAKDKSKCLELWEKYDAKAGKAFDVQHVLATQDADELRNYGDYFFQKENWPYAAQAYEKSERTTHDLKTLGNWYKSAEKAGQPFDFQWILGLKDAGEMRLIAYEYFKMGKYPEAKQLFEKAERIEHSPDTFLMLGMIAQQTGESFDIRKMVDAAPAAELPMYVDGIKNMFGKKKSLKDRIPGYILAVEVDERILLQDTSAETRKDVANDYNSLGYYQLFASDGKSAEKSIRRAMALDPANKFTTTNLAPALMLQGKQKKAKAEYRKWAKRPFNAQGLETYRDAFLDDLKTMEAAGVKMNFEQVKKWLGAQ